MSIEQRQKPSPYETLAEKVSDVQPAALAGYFNALPKPVDARLWMALEQSTQEAGAYVHAALIYFNAYRIGAPLPPDDENVAASVLNHLGGYLLQLEGDEQFDTYLEIAAWIEEARFPNANKNLGCPWVKVFRDMITAYTEHEAFERRVIDDLVRRSGSATTEYDGDTFLHTYAMCAYDKSGIVKRLLELGADPKKATSKRVCALQCALSSGRWDHHAEVMVAHGATLGGIDWSRVLKSNPAARRFHVRFLRDQSAKHGATHVRTRQQLPGRNL